MSRNPLIFGLFTRMSLVERVASGIPRMREEMKEAGLPEPVFTTDASFFTVEFRRPDDSGTVNGTVKFKTIDEEVVFELIKSKEGLSAPELILPRQPTVTQAPPGSDIYEIIYPGGIAL